VVTCGRNYKAQHRTWVVAYLFPLTAFEAGAIVSLSHSFWLRLSADEMATPPIAEIMQLGNDLMAMKCYTTAALALYVYDYLLTSSDEVKYIWRGRKTWMFYVFLANRYFPVVYVIWSRLYLDLDYNEELCNKVSIIGAAFVVWCTLIAQILLTTRIYALTCQNRLVAMCFAFITLVQFIVGLVVASTWGHPEKSKLSLNYTCTITININIELVYFSLSLFFDFAAFVATIVFAFRSTPQFPGFRANHLPDVLRTVVQDATLYFGVMFTSQLVFMMFQASARDGLKMIPAPGYIALLPILVSRLVLSLKKSIDTHYIDDWWIDRLTGRRMIIRGSATLELSTMEFAMDDLTVQSVSFQGRR